MLSAEEQAVVETVADWVDRQVRPVARDLEHANAYPEELIGQMKQMGIYGLAIPAPWGDAPVSMPCYALVTAELSRGWMSLAGAMGGHTVVAKLLLAFGTRELRLLHRVRRGALLPGRAADDRRRGHQRDPAQRHRRAAGRPRRALTLASGPNVGAAR